MRNRLKGWIRVLFTSSCWLQNHPYSEAWDTVLTSLMDSGSKFERVDDYEARIGLFTVWTLNHPYASFSPRGERWRVVRPKRITILRAMDKYMADIFSSDEIEQLAALERLGKL
jgi:hypothetical protein